MVAEIDAFETHDFTVETNKTDDEIINNKDRKKLKLNKLESSKFGDEWEAKMLWLCNFIASSYRYFFQTV